MKRTAAALAVCCLSMAAALIPTPNSGSLDESGPTRVNTRDGQVIPAATTQARALTGFDVAVPLSNKELARTAELIVIGQCRDTMILWIDRVLYTLATIDVAETLKGAPAMAVTVALPGGIDVNRKIPVSMTYPGAARMAAREDVLLFLVNANDQVAGTYAVLGLAQGKFSIVQTDVGVPVVSGHNSALGAGVSVPLATFKEEIMSHLR
jgi:hypothetical protein